MWKLSSLIERVPNSVRTKLALRAIGLSDDDIRDLDALILDVLGTPAVGVVLGRDIRSSADLVAYVTDLTEGSEGKFKKLEGILPLAKPFLSSDAGRMQAAGFLLKFLDSTGKHKEALVRLMTSVAKSDLFAGQDYKSVQEFLAYGVLPMVDRFLPEQVVNSAQPHVCELCNHVQGTLS